MTLGQLRSLTKSIMLGDKKVPDDEFFLPLLDVALYETAKKADSLILQTDNSFGNEIVRQLTSGMFIRRPEMPTSDDDTLDIEDVLAMGIAQHISSKLSKEKGGMFYNSWKQICKEYNMTIYSQYNLNKKNNMPDLFA